MSPDKSSEEEIFHAAREFTLPGEQAAYLARACGGNSNLRERIQKLLQIEVAAIEFFKPPSKTSGNLHQPSAILSEGAGTVIGRYKLREKIGEGGCGVVYVAEQLEPVRRLVALKLIKPGMDTKNVLARFEAERQALAMMDHQNIARVFDAGTADSGRPYFVMELVRGTKITDYCDASHLGLHQRLDLFVQVCLAVQHAHQKGVIHRDLKPSNILVTLHDGVPVPKVIDFGIAKAIEGRLTDATIYTELHHFIGTPAYMSPEQAEMSGLDIDTRSDIYSLGVLLYELITGRTPFDTSELLKSGLDAMRRTIREQEPIRPSTRLSTMLGPDLTAVAQNHGTESIRLIHLVGGDLDWIVMKALEKDRRRRYETANGLATDVRRHLSNEMVTARPPGKIYRLQKLIRRHRIAVSATAAITLILLLGATASTWEMFRALRAEKNAVSAREQTEIERRNEVVLREEAQRQALAARQNAYAADMSSAAHAVTEGDLGLARNLLGEYQKQAGRMDLRGFEWRYLWDQSHGDQARTLIGHSNYVNCLAYSPDGTILASGSSDHTVKFWNPKTGELIGTCAGHNGEVFSMAFTADGRLLATGCQDGIVRLWNVATREIVSTITNRPSRVAFAGSVLAMASDSSRWGFDGGNVRLWDYAANRELTTLPESGNRVVFAPDGKTFATANWDGEVKLWTLADKKVIKSFPGKFVRALVFSPDGRTLAWSAHEGEVWLWNLADEQPTVLIKGTGNLIFDMAFFPDGKMLALAGQSHDISLWDLSSRKEVSQFRGHGGQVWDLVFSPDGGTLASASSDETIMLWKVGSVRRPNSFMKIVTGEWQRVGRPMLSPDGKFLAAISRNGGIAIWDLATCQVAVQLETDGVPVDFSAKGQSLWVLVDRQTSLQEWDLATQMPHPKIPLGGVVDAAIFSPDHKMMAQSTRELEVVLRNGVTGETLFTLKETGRARSADFSADGDVLAVVNYEGTAHLWDLQTRQIVWTAKLKDGVEGFAFSSDGKMFAVGSWDGTIKVFDTGTKEELKSLTGHKAGITQLAFSNDGRTLASTGDDYFIRLWNLATSREITKLSTQNRIHFLHFTAADDTLVVTGADGVVQLLRAPAMSQIEAVTAASIPLAAPSIPK